MTTVPRRRTALGGDADSSSGALTGYEAELWQMADALRGSMDAAEYKHVVLASSSSSTSLTPSRELHAWLESRTAEGTTPKTWTSTAARTSSGYRRRPVGLTSKRRRGSRPSASGGRRHGRRRAGQPGAQGRAAQGLRPTCPRQDPPRPAH